MFFTEDVFNESIDCVVAALLCTFLNVREQVKGTFRFNTCHIRYAFYLLESVVAACFKCFSVRFSMFWIHIICSNGTVLRRFSNAGRRLGSQIGRASCRERGGKTEDEVQGRKEERELEGV